MAFAMTEKQTLLESLMATRSQADAAELRLRFQGKAEEADKIAQRTRVLSTEIDRLLAKIMEEWLGAATRLIGDVNAANGRLQAAVDDIKKTIAVAQRVVQALGMLDDVVAIAKKALI
jgi:hypothetical protein